MCSFLGLERSTNEKEINELELVDPQGLYDILLNIRALIGDRF